MKKTFFNTLWIMEHKKLAIIIYRSDYTRGAKGVALGAKLDAANFFGMKILLDTIK
jgi:hypothetical protein